MRISDWSSDVCSSDLAQSASVRPFGDLNLGNFFSNGPVAAAMRDARLDRSPLGILKWTRGDLGSRTVTRRKLGTASWARSEERRVGEEGVSKCRSRWSPDH